MYTASVTLDKTHYSTHIAVRDHILVADEPVSAGGEDRGPDPFELLLASVGSCTAITLRMYADRKSWPLETIEIKLTLEQKRAPLTTLITKQIFLEGALTEEQKQRLMQIADKCPTHQLLMHPLSIKSEYVNKNSKKPS